MMTMAMANNKYRISRKVSFGVKEQEPKTKIGMAHNEILTRTPSQAESISVDHNILKRCKTQKANNAHHQGFSEILFRNWE